MTCGREQPRAVIRINKLGEVKYQSNAEIWCVESATGAGSLHSVSKINPAVSPSLDIRWQLSLTYIKTQDRTC